MDGCRILPGSYPAVTNAAVLRTALSRGRTQLYLVPDAEGLSHRPHAAPSAAGVSVCCETDADDDPQGGSRPMARTGGPLPGGCGAAGLGRTVGRGIVAATGVV